MNWYVLVSFPKMPQDSSPDRQTTCTVERTNWILSQTQWRVNYFLPQTRCWLLPWNVEDKNYNSAFSEFLISTSWICVENKTFTWSLQIQVTIRSYLSSFLQSILSIRLYFCVFSQAVCWILLGPMAVVFLNMKGAMLDSQHGKAMGLEFTFKQSDSVKWVAISNEWLVLKIV